MTSSHFDSKEAIEHVVEKQAAGIVDAQEVHGTEIPGHFSAAADSLKESALYLCFLFVLLNRHEAIAIAFLFFMGLLVWKSGRSAWLGWARLERLHRVIAQEKWEIEHHRNQEREELKSLYEAKGFHGKLLDDVVDVLMADGDRLLKVMVEEELGLSLETQQHPLKQALGAFLGTLAGGLLVICGFFFMVEAGAIVAALIAIAFASTMSARYEHNSIIQAVIWNIGIAVLAIATAAFLAQTFNRSLPQ